MKIGIMGLPYSGKTTLFTTLLAHKIQDDNKKYKTDVEKGIVQVPDQRLDKLTSIFNPKKQVNATIEYVKVPGIDKKGHQGKGLPPQFLANAKTVDLVLLLIRDFENSMCPHPMKTVNPVRDINFIMSEFLLNDLAIIENRVEKLEKLIMKTQDEKDKLELMVLNKCKSFLEKDNPLRELELNNQEELAIRGYQFLTAKPILYVINIEEKDLKNIDNKVKNMEPFSNPKCSVIALSAEIEKEISLLNEEDAQDFFNDLGITEPITEKLIHASYDLLGLQSFFTVGDDECRSWTIRKGTKAQQAAGIIHSDLEKGFIKAEVVSYETLIEMKTLQACKEKGLLRLEGKEYIVQDGDIMDVRFNV